MHGESHDGTFNPILSQLAARFKCHPWLGAMRYTTKCEGLGLHHHQTQVFGNPGGMRASVTDTVCVAASRSGTLLAKYFNTNSTSEVRGSYTLLQSITNFVGRAAHPPIIVATRMVYMVSHIWIVSFHVDDLLQPENTRYHQPNRSIHVAHPNKSMPYAHLTVVLFARHMCR